MRNSTYCIRSNLNVVSISYFLINACTILINCTCKNEIVEACLAQTILNLDFISIVAACNSCAILLNLPVTCLVTWVNISDSESLVWLDNRLVCLDFVAIFIAIEDFVILAPSDLTLLLHIERYCRYTKLHLALTLKVYRNRIEHTCP